MYCLADLALLLIIVSTCNFKIVSTVRIQKIGVSRKPIKQYVFVERKMYKIMIKMSA